MSPVIDTPPVSPTSSMTRLTAEHESALYDTSTCLLNDALSRVLERISDADEIRAFIESRAEYFQSYSPDCEHMLEWTEIHNDYCQLVEETVQLELSVLGCTEALLLEHIMVSNDVVADRRIARLLAKTDYEHFCAMMHGYDYALRCGAPGDDEPCEFTRVSFEDDDEQHGQLSDEDDDEALEAVERSVATMSLRDQHVIGQSPSPEAVAPPRRRW